MDAGPTAETDARRDDQERLSQKFQRELNAGLVGLVLLAVLAKADEDLYGYQIAKRLQALAGGSPPVKQGALYPVLRMLSANGLLASRIVPSYAGPPRRYYRITEGGRRTLAEWQDIWRSTRDLVDGFTEANGASS